MRYSLLLLLLIWGFAQGLAQEKTKCNFKVQGIVYDAETRQPLPYVSIQIQGTSIGTNANEAGTFEFSDLCERDYDLIFSFLGYKTLIHHHDFHHSTITIYLAPEAVLLESVVVEEKASRDGLSSTTASTLSKENLKRVSSESLGDVASQIAGVNTISTGQNVVKPVIHGLHSNRILIVNEGLRHEFQNWGTDHAPEIDPSLVDQLQVIKGAATVRYGPDALGGVIRINAPELELSSPLRGDFSLTGKSNGQAAEGTLQLQKGFKWWSVLASGSYTKQGDLHAPDYQLTNTGKEEYSYSAGLRIHPLAQLDIEFFYSHFDQRLGILRGSVNTNLDDLLRALNAEVPNFTSPFSYDINTPKQEVVHDFYKARASWVGDHQSFELQYGYQVNQRQEFDVRRGTDLPVPNIDLELRTHSLDGEWIHPNLGRMQGRLGFQLARQANDNLPGTNTVPFVPNYDQDRAGVYLIESFRLNDQSTLEAGVRYDEQYTEVVGRKSNNNIYRNNFTYQNFTATIGYQTRWKDHHSFRTNLGTAWRPPNVAELYRFGRHLSFLEYGLWRYTINLERDLISTRDILTEEDRPAPSEIGYKWINTYNYGSQNTNLEITGYINYIENFINTRPGGLTSTVRGVSPFFIYDQQNALLWGIDLSIEQQHSKQLSSTFKGSYLWAKDVQQQDYFIGLPPANLQYEIAYQPKIKGLDKTIFRLGGQYTFEQFQHPRTLTVEEVINAFRLDLDLFANDASNFDIAAPPPAFFLLDFSSQVNYKKLELRFQVRNILNTNFRRYTDRLRYYSDDLGRNFILTLGYKFQQN